MKQIYKQDAEAKRKLSNVVLCYHGCVLGRADALIFRQHIDDIKNQIEELKTAGYTFVYPSEYDDWYEGAPGYEGPLAVIHLDDGLDSIIPICEWMIERAIPFGLAIISSRNNKYDPQQGFLRWSKLREWVQTGYCEILRHTHNIHNLTIVQSDGSPAPVLEGPCWIDEPANLIYRKPGDTRWYWDFSIIDKTTWGFPLFGSDPYSNFTTGINSDIHFIADTTTSVSIIRFWAALHRPAGAGYNCVIEVFADDVSLGEYTITPYDYETRSQWVEREFYTLQLSTSFNVVATQAHHLRFETKNTGNGTFILYVLPETSNNGFYCVTTCQSLTPGKAGPDHADFPAGRPWPGRAGLILASGSGRQATPLEYQNYIEADTTGQTNAIENWLNADWFESNTAYNEQRKLWSIFSIAGCNADGNTLTAMIKWVAIRPPGYDPLATTMTLESLQYKQVGPVGLRYACLVRVEISTAKNGPWTEVAEWVPAWAYYKWTNFDIDSTVVTIGATYWFRFTTLNRSYNADYPWVENPDKPDELIPGTNNGKIAIYLDMPFANLYDASYFTLDGTHEFVQVPGSEQIHKRLTVDDLAYLTWRGAYISYYPGYAVSGQDSYYIGNTQVYPQASGTMSGHVWTLQGSDVWTSKFIQGTPAYTDGAFSNFVTATLSGQTAIYGGDSSRSFYSIYGNALFGGLIAKRNPSAITYDQMIYPFGSFNADTSPTSEIKPVQPISAALQTVFDDAGIRSGYTIWPSRNDLPTRFRESFCRCTAHTKSRVLLYGDVTQLQTRSNLAHYTGLRWADAAHGGLKWQVAIEPDPLGNATVRNSYSAIDTVAFDAWFFAVPDIDHATGWIKTGALNDGGTYGGTLYHDDKSFLEAKGVNCSLIISNYDSGIGDISPAIASHVVNNPGVFIPLIVAIAADWDGITCNLEGIPEADRAPATLFYQALGTALRAAGKELHITAPARTNTDYDLGSEWWWGWCDHAKLIGYVDRMKIMTYTETGPGTPPGPHAPDWFIKATYEYIANVIPQFHHKRILVGVNAFGHIWRDAVGTVVDYGTSHACMTEAIRVGAEIQFIDGEAHFTYRDTQSWWGSPATINRAVDAAVRYGFGGVGVWKGDDGDIDEHFPLWPQLGVTDLSSFINMRFPDDVRFGFVGGPVYKTDVGSSDSGAEQRGLRWPEPIYEYTADLQKIGSEIEQVQAFFRIAKGRYHSFRFKDWIDYRAVDAFLGLGTGALITYQLRKAYQYGAEIEYRTISKPVLNTVEVSVNGLLTTDFTVNYLTGVITMTSPPVSGAVITATFDFDVQVRFDQDRFPVSKNNPATFEMSSISLVEVRE